MAFTALAATDLLLTVERPAPSFQDGLWCGRDGRDELQTLFAASSPWERIVVASSALRRQPKVQSDQVF
jgi:hypothetical protein